MNKEITWNIINSLLAAGLVFAGGCAAGELTWSVVGAAGIAAVIVMITKFKTYWENEEKEYKDKKKTTQKLFSFLP